LQVPKVAENQNSILAETLIIVAILSFQSIEYLLAAIGGCLTVNWGKLIKKMWLKVEGMQITASGWRDRKEPQLKETTYKIRIVTDEPEDRILHFKELAEKYGTVFNSRGRKDKRGVEIIRRAGGES